MPIPRCSGCVVSGSTPTRPNENRRLSIGRELDVYSYRMLCGQALAGDQVQTMLTDENVQFRTHRLWWIGAGLCSKPQGGVTYFSPLRPFLEPIKKPGRNGSSISSRQNN